MIKPRRKYGNKKCDGFDSIREARRYKDLSYLQKSGMISDLKTQVTYVVVPKTEKFRAVKYIADFTYLDATGKFVCEDSKGMKTRLFIVKQKLMFHVHGIEVICT